MLPLTSQSWCVPRHRRGCSHCSLRTPRRFVFLIGSFNGPAKTRRQQINPKNGAPSHGCIFRAVDQTRHGSKEYTSVQPQTNACLLSPPAGLLLQSQSGNPEQAQNDIDDRWTAPGRHPARLAALGFLPTALQRQSLPCSPAQIKIAPRSRWRKRCP